MLEPCDAKVSSAVLRGPGDRKVASLLGHSSRIAHPVYSVQVGCLHSTEPRSLDVARPCHGESGIHIGILQTLNIPVMLRFRIFSVGWTNSSDVNQEKG
jgi:hypothetical protein